MTKLEIALIELKLKKESKQLKERKEKELEELRRKFGFDRKKQYEFKVEWVG